MDVVDLKYPLPFGKGRTIYQKINDALLARTCPTITAGVSLKFSLFLLPKAPNIEAILTSIHNNIYGSQYSGYAIKHTQFTYPLCQLPFSIHNSMYGYYHTKLCQLAYIACQQAYICTLCMLVSLYRMLVSIYGNTLYMLVSIYRSGLCGQLTYVDNIVCAHYVYY